MDFDFITVVLMLGATATLLTSIAEVIKAIATLIDSIKQPTAPKKRKRTNRKR
ncbi:TPA: hypothetical protein ACGOTU_002110 [Streptococcus suis]